MIKELKIFFYILVIIIFLIFTGGFYFSDKNKKNTFKSINNINSKISTFSKNLIVLKNDTNDIIEHIENEKNNDRKKYYFLELLKNND